MDNKSDIPEDFRFKTDFCNYKVLKTGDSSITLYSEGYGEACHSLASSVEETRHNFIQGCDILAKADQELTLNILEVGYGTGLGYQETIRALAASGIDCNLNFISLEIDPELIEWSKENLAPVDSKYPSVKALELKNSLRGPYYETTNGYGTLTVLLGDARKIWEGWKSTLPEIHAIYQDAFSPRNNPTLWTVEWFTQLKDVAAEDCILSTYSAARAIRKGLVEAGWIVEETAGFGPKRDSTRAKLTGELEPGLQIKLERSPTRALRDELVGQNLH